MTTIHGTASVDPSARLGLDVEIGAYCIVGPRVEIGDRVVLHSHAVVTGLTCLGAGCEVFSHASIGYMPQHMNYRGEETSLMVGECTTIRERVTINRGTEGGARATIVGSRCVLMPGSHVGHDCHLGDQVLLGSSVSLGGHVTVDDYAVLGTLSAVHQFVRIGAHAFVGEGCGITADIIPFARATVNGRVAKLSGLNIEGLERHGFPQDQIQALHQAYRLLFAPEGTLVERLTDVTKIFNANSVVRQVIDFIESGSERSFCIPGDGAASAQLAE